MAQKQTSEAPMDITNTINGTAGTMSRLGRVALPSTRTAIPALEIREGRYLARFARAPEELDAALKLRYLNSIE
jgi:hypothetical protein